MFGDDLFKDEMTEKEMKQNLYKHQQQQLETNFEKLSFLIEKPFDQYAEDEVKELRMQIINLSATIGNLWRKLYECIENDLLNSLQQENHHIIPYMSNGVERASEVPVWWDTKAYDTEQNLRKRKGTMQVEPCHQPSSGFESSSEDRHSSQKRAKGWALGHYLIHYPVLQTDLNNRRSIVMVAKMFIGNFRAVYC